MTLHSEIELSPDVMVQLWSMPASTGSKARRCLRGTLRFAAEGQLQRERLSDRVPVAEKGSGIPVNLVAGQFKSDRLVRAGGKEQVPAAEGTGG